MRRWPSFFCIFGAFMRRYNGSGIPDPFESKIPRPISPEYFSDVCFTFLKLSSLFSYTMNVVRGFDRKHASVGLGISIILSIFTITTIQMNLFTQNFQSFPSLSWYVILRSPKIGKVLLPAGYDIPLSLLKSHLKGTSAKHWKIIYLPDRKSMKIPPREDHMCETTDSFLYSITKEEDCAKKRSNLGLDVGKSLNLSFDLDKILEVFKEEATVYGDTYNQHIWPVWENRTSSEDIKSKWFRLSGSSVWLKDYNVHFVVSRLVFSKIIKRDQPRISLSLAQVFDKNWKELENVSIVFPSNSVKDAPGFDVNRQRFSSHRSPRLLPIPFDIGNTEKYWGAEDPRLFLVQDANGHEERVMVLNSLLVSPSTNPPVIRKMFLSFPFQLQQGKTAEVPQNERTKNDWFTRTKQMTVKGDPQGKTEKNWSPILQRPGSNSEHLLIATQIEPLRVIKCEWWTEEEECQILGSSGRDVGPLRGGTPFVSVKTAGNENKEYFVGFARANLANCGCGQRFYRPYLVVLRRDIDEWKLTHVTSFIDLKMKVTAWNLDEEVCCSANAIIPNGIEFWDQDQDVLSLFNSVSDSTVERIEVRGVLSALSKANIWEARAEENMISPVKCALEKSKQFCEDYGKVHIDTSIPETND